MNGRHYGSWGAGFQRKKKFVKTFALYSLTAPPVAPSLSRSFTGYCKCPNTSRHPVCLCHPPPLLSQAKQVVPHEADCVVEKINATMCDAFKCIYVPACRARACVWVRIQHSVAVLGGQKRRKKNNDYKFIFHNVAVSWESCLTTSHVMWPSTAKQEKNQTPENGTPTMITERDTIGEPW